MALRAQHLIQFANHVHRQAHGTRLVHDRALDALADPPRGIRRKTEATRRIEFFDRMHQAEIAFFDQIEQRHAAIQIALRDADDQPQIALDHDLPRFELARLGKTRILLLFLDGQQRLDANAIQVMLDRVGRKFGLQQRAEIVGVGRGFGCALAGVAGFFAHRPGVRRDRVLLRPLLPLPKRHLPPPKRTVARLIVSDSACGGRRFDFGMVVSLIAAANTSVGRQVYPAGELRNATSRGRNRYCPSQRSSALWSPRPPLLPSKRGYVHTP